MMIFPDLLLVGFKKKSFSKTVHLACNEFVMTNLLCLLPVHVRSPTSPLDLKFFTGLGTKSPRAFSVHASQKQKILLGDRVELGLMDFLTHNKTPHPWMLERFFLDLRLGFLITCLVRTAPLLLFMLGG
ncbi:hypothetical protein BDA96_01G188300 [Sorghum bicolor]|jgi:hypothetical protein|uniref:Uncharacterized protein n=2 Tax=Sorghum bicolor TaxID=4558 RepID=A0A921RYU4_SORBI|nr:hypothetical protein BDA96_01G188300 [Sorghum bicolor]OQU91428.1 hypothetical protein SORBI_3001G179560 [Sorghum bicolor]